MRPGNRRTVAPAGPGSEQALVEPALGRGS